MPKRPREAEEILRPTWYGYLKDPVEALIVVEACLQGAMDFVDRRPTESELPGLILSGNIFVYAEDLCNFQRWHDGLAWSPSRHIDGFLAYRELQPVSTPEAPVDSAILEPLPQNVLDHEKEICGPLIDPNQFRGRGGLMKKACNFVIDGHKINVVTYFTLEDVVAGVLPLPSEQFVWSGPEFPDLHTSAVATLLNNIQKKTK